MALTEFTNKCEILAELWMDYRDDVEFKDFIEYSDLGLPLAYAFANGIVEPSTMGEDFVIEAFNLFLAGLGIQDSGFDNLQEVLDVDSK